MDTAHHGNAHYAPNIRQLRHDLLNPLNVLFGMTKVLLDMELTETQRTCVQACRNSAERLLDMAHHLERYLEESSAHDPAGPAQLADLCSIAAARVDKPFDRDTLLQVVRELAPVPAPRILLVDDAPEIAVLVRTFLQETSCTLDVVADGESAVAQAASQSYDLVHHGHRSAGPRWRDRCARHPRRGSGAGRETNAGRRDVGRRERVSADHV